MAWSDAAREAAALARKMHTNFPTPKKDWPKEGHEIISSAGMKGTVLKVMKINKLPDVKVRWENGHVGNVRITNVRRYK